MDEYDKTRFLKGLTIEQITNPPQIEGVQDLMVVKPFLAVGLSLSTYGGLIVLNELRKTCINYEELDRI